MARIGNVVKKADYSLQSTNLTFVNSVFDEPAY